jgi:hypothetical protein
MNKKISEIEQKPTVQILEGKKKPIEEIESWMIQEYFVPFQAS